MFLRFSTAFAILVFALIATQSNAQNGDCVGVHITQWWDCASGTANAYAIPDGGTPPYTYHWSNGDTNQLTSGLQPGQHHITVTDAANCLHVEACIIVVPECCLWASITSTPDDCHLGNNGQAVIWEIGGGIAPYTILLPNGTTKTNYGNTPLFINNLPAGVYYITITDASGCSIEQPIEIEQQAAPTVKLTANALTCNETTTTINTQVTGTPVSYLWNTGATTSSLMNVGPGTYTVKVTNPSGCFDADTINITAPAQVTLHATATPTACGENNGALTLTSGPWPITVESPNGSIFNLNGPTATISNLQSGVYTATVTNGSGCTMVESAVVGDSDPAKDSLECITICQPGFVNGTWVATSTTLTETLINSNGCPFVFTTKVNLQSTDTTHQTAYTCFGGVITVNGVSYQKDTVVYVQMNGNCPGLTVWNLQFSDEPGSVSLPPVKICGGDSLATYTFTNTIGTGCPELIVTRTFEQHPYTMQFALTSADTICGLVNRTDSLFRNITVDNVNCIIKQPYGLLVTNLPTTTITPGPTHYFCGTPADSVWVETSDVFDLPNCKRDITGYWQVTTPQPILKRDTIFTCYPAIAAQYPQFKPGTDCNPDTLTTAVLEEKPALVFVYQDTCYAGQLPMAPIMINHPGNNCLGDTIVILNPHQSVTVTRHENLCDGQSLVWQGDMITTPGTWTKVVGQTTFGCDSLETISVDVIHGQKFSQTKDTCIQGLSPVVNFVTSPNGCQDTIETIWNFKPNFGSLVEKSCNGPVTDTTYNVVDQWGCVTIMTCHRERYSTDQGHEIMQVCPNVFPFNWHDQIVNAEGEYTATLPAASVNGCDSTVNLTVMVKPLRKGSLTVKICPNEDYAWNDEFLAGSNEGITYTRIIPGIGDYCDSVLTITVITYNWFANLDWGYDTTLVFQPGTTIFSAQSIISASAGQFHAQTVVDQDTITATISSFNWVNDTTGIAMLVLETPCGDMETERVVHITILPKPKPPVAPCELLVRADQATHSIHITLNPEGFDASQVERVDWVVFSPLDPMGSGQAGFSSSSDFMIPVSHIAIDPETWYVQVKNIRIDGQDFEPESGANTKFCVKFEH